ncbi:rifin [Plasmodium falciparum RAJ116]|uniref:Rifin n=1 Tax=Plasmodium falciparum RAJ116 TaxID=580058 RepID=A0A0L0D1H2_PLAFA|nr:rifin [Plasmodium falciparum RAJ116]
MWEFIFLPANLCISDPENEKGVMQPICGIGQPQRFHEYDERDENLHRQKNVKNNVNKGNSKKIYFKKIKLEKEFNGQILLPLQTDIPNVFGGGVAPGVGLLGGIGEAIMSAWKVAALKAAIAAANKAGMAAGIKAGDAAGMNVVIVQLGKWGIEKYCPGIYQSILKISHYSKVKDFAGAIIKKHREICAMSASVENPMCLPFDIALGLKNAEGQQIAPPANVAIPEKINGLAGKAETTANIHGADVTSKITTQLRTEQTNVINTIYGSWETTIIASIVAIVIIVLIMVIIYLILRYRRKKKMKKKLQYIKLLEE